MDMQIREVKADTARTVVVTTGAEFVFPRQGSPPGAVHPVGLPGVECRALA
jgi:hypothetical protein